MQSPRYKLQKKIKAPERCSAKPSSDLMDQMTIQSDLADVNKKSVESSIDKVQIMN